MPGSRATHRCGRGAKEMRERPYAPATLRVLRPENGADARQIAAERQQAEERLRLAAAVIEAAADSIVVTDAMLDRPGPRILSVNPAFEAMTGYRQDEVLGRTPRLLQGPATDPAELDRLRRELAAHGTFAGKTVNYRKDGTPFTIEWSVSAVRSPAGQVTHYVSVQRDVTALEQYAARLAVLHQLDTAILAARSTVEIARAAVAHIRQTVPATRCSVLLTCAREDDEGEDALCLVASDPPEAGPLSIGARVLLRDVPRIDPRHDDVFARDDLRDAPGLSRVETLLAEAHIRSVMSAPIAIDGTLLGLLTITAREPAAFSREHREIVQEIARKLAVAIRSARMNEEIAASREQLRALSQRLVEVQEDERRGLARELHDEIGQTLTALKILLQTQAPDDPTTAESLGLVHELLGRVRRLTGQLRPTALDDLGLLPALNWMLERFERQVNIRVHLFVFGVQARLTSALEHTLYRVVQEALTNVARHAHTHTVLVVLQEEPDGVHLFVEDQGRGFEPEDVPAFAASGLRGMRERVLLLDGTFRLTSAPGQGTRIHVVLPLLLAPDTDPAAP